MFKVGITVRNTERPRDAVAMAFRGLRYWWIAGGLHFHTVLVCLRCLLTLTCNKHTFYRLRVEEVESKGWWFATSPFDVVINELICITELHRREPRNVLVVCKTLEWIKVKRVCEREHSAEDSSNLLCGAVMCMSEREGASG